MDEVSELVGSDQRLRERNTAQDDRCGPMWHDLMNRRDVAWRHRTAGDVFVTSFLYLAGAVGEGLSQLDPYRGKAYDEVAS